MAYTKELNEIKQWFQNSGMEYFSVQEVVNLIDTWRPMSALKAEFLAPIILKKYYVKYSHYTAIKIGLIKAAREIDTTLGLIEAKDLIDELFDVSENKGIKTKYLT